MDKELLEWFREAYPQLSRKKLDMGKSYIRFKNIDSIPLELIGKLASRMSLQEWISLFEETVKS